MMTVRRRQLIRFAQMSVALCLALAAVPCLYRVGNGVRKMIANHDQTIDLTHWHRLLASCRLAKSRSFTMTRVSSIGGDKSLTVGKIGLWTKSDAVSYFDDLELVRHK